MPKRVSFLALSASAISRSNDTHIPGFSGAFFGSLEMALFETLSYLLNEKQKKNFLTLVFERCS